MFVTSAVLGIAIAILAPLMARLNAHRQVIDEQQWAAAEVDNLLEDLTSRPFAELTPEAATAFKVSDAGRARLDEAVLDVDLKDIAAAESAPASRKVTVNLTWKSKSGVSKAASVSTWIHEVPR